MTLRAFLSGFLVVLMGVTALSAQTTKLVGPAFNVTSLDGKTFDSGSLLGKVVVIDFWFTGCIPCLEEMPKLNRLAEEFEGKGVVFIAPTWDKGPILQNFLKDHPFRYHIVPSAKDMVLASCRDGEGNVVVPVHMVIGRDGKVEKRVEGGFTTEDGKKDYDDLRGTILRLLVPPPVKN